MTIAPVSTSMGAPTSAFIQLSDRCNHACTHCYQVHGERGEMTTSEVERLLDEMAEAGVLFLTLTGGEVTLRPDFLQIVAHARHHGFAVRIYTNAYRVDDELARQLAAHAVLEVHVSLYSARAAEHDSVTLVPGSFERTIAGVRAMRRYGLKVVLKMPLMGVNAGTYREVIALAESMGCQYTLDPMVDVREDGHRSTAAMRASQEALARFLSDSALGLPEPGAPLEEKPLDHQPCGACGTAYVMPDGTVRPCTSLPFEVGHVRESSYAEVFRDSPTARFVRGLSWGDLPACRVCELRQYCSRCHAAALLEDGDLFGPSSNSCQLARTAFHQWTKTPLDGLEPVVGPYRVIDGRAIEGLPYERSERKIPDDVKWAAVQGKSAPAEAPSDIAGAPSSRSRVRLTVLGGR